MKLQAQLDEVVTRYKKIPVKDLLNYIKHVKSLHNYQDLETRIVWDCLWKLVGSQRIAEWQKTLSFNDNHLDTLARKAFKIAFPSVEL